MNADLLPSHSGFDRPAIYRIGVKGRIPPRWCDRLEGMAVMECATEAADSPLTTLEGKLADQAALAGLLNTLFQLHLSVVSVERLSAE
jgi:hypothetical protein